MVNKERSIEELSTEMERFSAPVTGGNAFRKRTDSSLGSPALKSRTQAELPIQKTDNKIAVL